MTTDEIIATLRQFIRTQFNISNTDAEFTDDVHLFDYGYIDSFGAVTLTNFVENSFAIKVTESDMVAFPLNTVRNISEFVARRQRGEI